MMRDLIETTNFYHDLMKTEKEIPEIFKELSVIGVKEEYELLLDRFHEKLRSEFRMVRFNITETTHEEKFDMPSGLFKRVGITTMMLTVMSLGRLYDEELYNDTVKYIENIKKINH